MAGRGKLIAVIGDEDTCTGFLLGGIGELNKNRKPNFLVVEKDTSITEIEETFKYDPPSNTHGLYSGPLHQTPFNNQLVLMRFEVHYFVDCFNHEATDVNSAYK